MLQPLMMAGKLGLKFLPAIGAAAGAAPGLRKGNIGDWQESLEPRLVKEIENNFKKEMKELGYI